MDINAVVYMLLFEPELWSLMWLMI